MIFLKYHICLLKEYKILKRTVVVKIDRFYYIMINLKYHIFCQI